MRKTVTVHQLRRRPEYIRYVVILQTEEEGPKIATTYCHVERVLDKHNVTGAWVVDMSSEALIPLVKDLSRFMELWRENYLDPDWSFKA